MKWRYLMVLSALCLLPTACADMDAADIPPITSVDTTPPVSEVPDSPPVVPDDDGGNNNDPGDHPHYFPASTPHVQATPNYTFEEAHPNTQINPCLLHPEDC
ncbi:MAG: hypothetical protein K8R69_09450 [Deltaproteobacteria bacterium]|nr:hypothetical protein [Deltaproteobacteria bacterium]